MMSFALVDPFYKAFGVLVKQHRDRREGMTQSKLGSLVGLSRTSITNIEKGRQHVSLHQVYAIAFALRISPDALLPTARNDGDEDWLEDRLPAGTDPQIAAWANSIVSKQSQKESTSETS